MEHTSSFDPEKIRLKKLAESFKVKSYELATVDDVDMTKRTVTGVSNMFYYFDHDFDVLALGSTKKTINENGPNSSIPGKIKHALFHDLTKIPFKNTLLEEREVFKKGYQGQYFESKALNTTDGNDSLIKYQEGVYDQHSIGFQYLDIEYIEDGSTNWKKYIDKLINPEDAEKVGFMFWVKEIKQYEFSTVAFGANQLTPYLGVKSDNKEVRMLKLQEKIDRAVKLLKNGRLSDDGFAFLELELLQLKQLLTETLEEEPSLKDTLIKSRLEKDTPAPTLSMSDAIKEINFFK